MRVSICTHKGGTGKTTIAMHIARARSLQGKKVLYIDLDPQANSSYKLLQSYRDFKKLTDIKTSTVYHTLVDKGPLPIYKSIHENIDIVPSALHISEAENLLQSKQGLVHARLLHGIQEVEDRYDDVIIDSPPTLSIIYTNGAFAADLILIVADPGDFSLIAIEQMHENITTLINEEFNHYPTIKILFNKYASNENLSKETYESIKKTFPSLLTDTFIARRTDIASAVSEGSTLFDLKPNHPSIKDFYNLTSEIFKS